MGTYAVEKIVVMAKFGGAKQYCGVWFEEKNGVPQLVRLTKIKGVSSSEHSSSPASFYKFIEMVDKYKT